MSIFTGNSIHEYKISKKGAVYWKCPICQKFYRGIPLSDYCYKCKDKEEKK